MALQRTGKDGGQQRGLALKIGVEGHPGDADLGDDVVQLGFIIAALGKAFRGRA